MPVPPVPSSENIQLIFDALKKLTDDIAALAARVQELEKEIEAPTTSYRELDERGR
jgi:ubiquinone biosynthesis protein UbiJ